MDFTLKTYQKLLESLQNSGYEFFTFEAYCNKIASGKFVILRHDVDLRAAHSLATARVEAELGIKASYYFRVVRQSNKPEIIKAIAALGHEIGYHYEDMSLVKGNSSIAVDHFSAKLAYFRRFYPVKTICMHGSPTSKIDNRSLWKYYDYRDFGLIGEPYFDIDFTKVFYLTDTGRCWDGDKFSVRDKVDAHFNVTYHSTNEIINAANGKTLPLQIMITTHPQRWTDNVIEWFVELFMQNAKNTIKRLIVK
jgi:hypothetical protein